MSGLGLKTSVSLKSGMILLPTVLCWKQCFLVFKQACCDQEFHLNTGVVYTVFLTKIYYVDIKGQLEMRYFNINDWI